MASARDTALPPTCLPYTLLICSMLLVPVSWPVARYASAASTLSEPMDTLSAPDLHTGHGNRNRGFMARFSRQKAVWAGHGVRLEPQLRELWLEL